VQDKITTIPSSATSKAKACGPSRASASEAPPAVAHRGGLSGPCSRIGTLQLRPRWQVPLDLDSKQLGMGGRLLREARKIKSLGRVFLPPMGPALLGSCCAGSWQRAPQPQHPVRPGRGWIRFELAKPDRCHQNSPATPACRGSAPAATASRPTA